MGLRDLETDIELRNTKRDIGMTKKHEDKTKRQKISRYIGLRDTEIDIGLRDIETDIELRDTEMDIGLRDTEMDIGLIDIETDIELIDTEINISLNKSKRHRDRGKF